MNLPLTIWRQALSEMGRLFILSTVVLVTVVSFALTVKFFAEGRLGPLETLHFMALATVPMLQYTVPFAACFAATIAYHRMAADNEITAAQAGGISHAALLAPALASGLVLAAVIALLAGQIVPRFLWSMENLVTKKVGKLVMGSIQRREPIQQGGMMIYADEVTIAPPDRANGAEDAFTLFGVVATQFDDSGVLEFEATARTARVQVYPGRGERSASAAIPRGGQVGDTLITVVMLDATVKEGGALGQAGEVRRAFTVPGGFEDDPKYYTWQGLRELRRDPDRLYYIDSSRRDLAFHLGERRVIASIAKALNSDGRASLDAEGGDVFVVEARDIKYQPGRRGGDNRWELSAAPGRPIVVERFAGGSVTRFIARSAGLTTDMGSDPSTRYLLVGLELEDVASAAAGQAAGELATQTFPGLSLRENPLPDLLAQSSADLLAEADRRLAQPNPDLFLDPPARELRARSVKLQREITSKQHERSALAVAGLVMIVTGAVTALRLRGRLPLTVYLWSFFPALGAVITISAGQQMIEPLGNVGLIPLWGGVAALGAYSVVAYRTVRRH